VHEETSDLRDFKVAQLEEKPSMRGHKCLAELVEEGGFKMQKLYLI